MSDVPVQGNVLTLNKTKHEHLMEQKPGVILADRPNIKATLTEQALSSCIGAVLTSFIGI